MAVLKLQLSAPVQSVKMIGGTEGGNSVSQTQSFVQQEEQHIMQLGSLCSALQQAVTAFQQLHEELFLSHKEQIARLSVEIAAKILAKDIHERNYQIENIIAESLKTVDVSEQVTVRLNSEDLKAFQLAVENKKIELPEKVLFVNDTMVNRAECIIETSEGIVEYLIQEHLSLIENALSDMQTQVEQV